jgi:HEAT repeat protein
MKGAARALALLAMAASSCHTEDAARSPADTPPQRAAALPENNTMTKTTNPSDYRRQLDDPDEAVRAKAALALHAMNDPGALDACMKTLDDAADPLHNDRTPAVQCLVEIGPRALPSLFAPLAAADSMTRLHAQRAVEGITRRMQGFDGREWKTGTADDWIAWWEKIDYAYDAPADARAAAIERLHAWVNAHER